MTQADQRNAPAMPGTWERRHKIIYMIRLSALYHLKRERFFDGVDKLITALVAISATASVTLLFKDSGAVEKWTAVATAVLSLIPVIYNPAQRARHHNQLATEYRRLLADCETLGESWQESDCNAFSGRTVQISAAEPPPLSALVADCQNQLALAFNSPPPADMKWWHHCFKHFFDVRPEQISSQPS